MLSNSILAVRLIPVKLYKETKTETVETEKKPTTRRKKATTEEVKD